MLVTQGTFSPSTLGAMAEALRKQTKMVGRVLVESECGAVVLG